MVTQPERGQFLEWLHDDQAREWGRNIDDRDPEAVQAVLDKLQLLFGPGRYFRTEYHGFDRVPDEPTLVVANHSGGTSFPDAWGLGLGWYQHLGIDRAIHALAHDMVFALGATARPFAKLGILRADKQLAIEVLRDWRRDVIVMPGGDLETWRPYRDRYKVRFNGRKGYARLALKAGVPITPIVHAGSHQTLVVLTDGQRIARTLRFDKLFRAHIFPIHLSLPYGLGIGPWPHIPPPCRLRYRVATPIRLDEPGGREPTKAAVDELDRRVRAAMQHELNILRDDERGLRDRVKGALRSLR